MGKKLGVILPAAMAIGLENQAASTYCTYGVLLPCRNCFLKNARKIETGFLDGHLTAWLPVLPALLQPCRRLHTSKPKKQASSFVLTTGETRQQNWPPATSVSCWFQVTARTEVVHWDKEALQGFLGLQQQPPRRISCDLEQNIRKQLRRWSVIRGRDRLTCYFSF